MRVLVEAAVVPFRRPKFRQQNALSRVCGCIDLAGQARGSICRATLSGPFDPGSLPDTFGASICEKIHRGCPNEVRRRAQFTHDLAAAHVLCCPEKTSHVNNCRSCGSTYTSRTCSIDSAACLVFNLRLPRM